MLKTERTLLISRVAIFCYWIPSCTEVLNIVLERKSNHIEQCRVGSVVSVSGSHTVGREFTSRPGHTKDHHKNGSNCLPA